MNYYLFIPFGIILLLIMPIKMKVRVSFNVLEMSGALGIFIFGIKIQDLIFWFKKNKLVSMKNNKAHSKELEFDSDSMVFVEVFASQLKNKTHLREISLIYNLGCQDAFLTSMVAGYLNQAIVDAFAIIKSYRPTARLGMLNNIAYNQKVCTFALRSRLSISLFDVVYSLARSVMLTKKKFTLKNKPKEAT